MRLARHILSMVVLIGCLSMAVAVFGEQKSIEDRPCMGPYKDRTLTPEELATVLRNHQAWLESGMKSDDERRANLCQADLSGANLQGADLRGPTCRGPTCARPTCRGPACTGPTCRRPTWSRPTCRRPTWFGANLQGADLRGANLQGGRLLGANLAGAIYEPKPGTLPNFWTLTNPDNHLETLVFHDSPAALIALREAFKKGGMRTQERQLTYAIEHTKQLQAWDPSWYDPDGRGHAAVAGAAGGQERESVQLRAVRAPVWLWHGPQPCPCHLGLLILVFSLVYMVALLTARGRAGIWVTWPTDRVYQEEGAKEATRVTNTFFFPR